MALRILKAAIAMYMCLMMVDMGNGIGIGCEGKCLAWLVVVGMYKVCTVQNSTVEYRKWDRFEKATEKKPKSMGVLIGPRRAQDGQTGFDSGSGNDGQAESRQNGE